MRLATLVLLAATFGLVLPLAGANKVPVLDDQCTPSNEVSAPPTAALVNWKPACIMTSNGATVTWKMQDPAGDHGPRVIDCMGDRQLFVNGQQVAYKVTYDRAAKLVTFAGPRTTTCPLGEDMREEGNRLVVDYDCARHGSSMPGKLVVEL